MRKSVAVLASAALAAVLACGVAWAGTFAVTNANNTGPGSLRAAITQANANPGKDVITFSPGARGTIRLRSVLPTLHGELEVRGPGPSSLTVRRDVQRPFRIFAVARNSTVRVTGLTVANGFVEDTPDSGCSAAGSGGGVRNDGTLTLRDVVVTRNAAQCNGGGVANGGTLTVEDSAVSSNDGWTGGAGISNGGALTVRRTTFSANRGFSGGGAIANFAEATVAGSAFSGNRIVGNGGAIFNYGEYGDPPSENPRLMVTGTTFSGNAATFERGGGGAIFIASAEATVRGSAFSGNRAGQGGAIEANRGTVTVENSTFSANTAGERGGGVSTFEGEVRIAGSTFLANRTGGPGGGVSSQDGLVRISNSTFARNEAGSGGGLYNARARSSFVGSSTFANNVATERGGGLWNQPSQDPTVDPPLYPRATIVSGNEAPVGPDVSGPVTSRGHNLVGDPSGSSGFGATDLTNTGAGLDPQGLRDNGGPTRTIALTASSPATDAVEEGCPPPATDQRGVSRPQNGDGEGGALCDIGAFERQAP